MLKDALPQVAPENIPVNPIGTLAELQGEGYDPRFYPSCSMPSEDNEGCRKFRVCGFDKGQGPENYAWAQSKATSLGGRTRQGCGPCFDCLHIQQQVENQGGLFEILGGPGTKYSRRETQSWAEVESAKWRAEHDEDEPIPAEIRRAAYDRDHPKFGVRMKVEVECTVEPFLRIGENPDLIRDQSDAKTRERLRGIAKERRLERTAGIYNPDDDGQEVTGVRTRPRPARRRSEEPPPE